MLSSSSSLCIVIDESTNIANYRIINTSVIIDSSVSIYHLNKEVEYRKIEAKELVAHIVKEAKDIIGRDLLKWIAVTLDTCVIIRAFREVLHKTPNIAHVVPILCNSYGLQLIIKDLL
jgi:hypothetical protein